MAAFTLPASWHASGARFGADGLLYIPEWRRGFTADELRATFWRVQQVATLERELRTKTRECEQLTAELERAERRTAFYRNNLVLESRLGMCLARIASS